MTYAEAIDLLLKLGPCAEQPEQEDNADDDASEWRAVGGVGLLTEEQVKRRLSEPFTVGA